MYLGKTENGKTGINNNAQTAAISVALDEEKRSVGDSYIQETATFYDLRRGPGISRARKSAEDGELRRVSVLKKRKEKGNLRRIIVRGSL